MVKIKCYKYKTSHLIYPALDSPEEVEVSKLGS